MTKPRKKRDTGPGFDPAALDALLGERRTMGEVDELFRQMKKALMERALAGELTHHPGYAPGAEAVVLGSAAYADAMGDGPAVDRRPATLRGAVR